MPALAFDATGRSPAASRMSATAASVSARLAPQLAPMPSMPSSERRRPASVPVRPIIVRPAVSKLRVATTGRSVARLEPRSAASTVGRSLRVSIQIRSAPPASRASACSAKAASVSASERAPSGSINSPVGPIEPATSTCLSASSAARRAHRIPAALISATRPCRSWSLSRCRLPPKVLLTTMSEPAAT